MKLHRFFIAPGMIEGGMIRIDDAGILHQMKDVLRFKPNDTVVFLDGTGKEYEAVIAELAPKFLRADITETRENKNEPALRITLYQSLCKKDKFEWIVEKGTEVGVTAFVPVQASRSEKLGLNRERAERILQEAAEQSERGIVPSLGETLSVAEALDAAQGEKILLDGSGESIHTFDFRHSTDRLNLFVGPEGGWAPEEIALAREKGARIVSMGPRVLRTETAGMVAAAVFLMKGEGVY
ncbi:16S rRNA (uracil(1498)-N(3))-methyltransferase [Patescibacteria group bacterium]|nr:16S rRNA (uracil(1498)-N(3))-methyltransferase [Patescibacteria group bacterium]